jgi:hypothetical protein
MENQNVCLESAGVDESAGCVAYNRIPVFHRQMYTLYNGGVIDVIPTGNGSNNGNTNTSTTPTQPTITTPSSSSNTTIPSANSVTFTWTSTSTTFLTRFATTSSDGTLLGTALMDNSYTGTSRSYPVVPGNYYKFWVHAGIISDYSPQDEINVYVSPNSVQTYTVNVSKTGTGTGSVIGVNQQLTTLNQGDTITLTAEADANSIFTGWSGDCSGTGSCVINNIQANRNISANFNSTLSPQFVNGDRVQATKNVNVRSSPSLGGSTNLLGVQNTGSIGTATSSHTIADGVVWYYINYDTGVDGYSGQDNFIKYNTTPNDTDNDNISDSQDKCPNTPSNLAANVNQYGCPKPIATNIKIKNNIDTEDITNISNLEIEDKNSSYGKIKFNQPVNIFGTTNKTSRVDLDTNIQILNKKVIVNSTNAPQFNKPATITLYGITYNKPIIKKDGEVYATSTSPHIVSYDKTTGTLVFTVSGFSTYDILEDTTTHTLSASKIGTGTGSIVGISSATTTYTEGTQVSLTAEANSGSTFSGWGGDCLGTGTCTLTMNTNKSITANFTLNTVSTPVNSGGGNTSAGGGGSVTTNTSAGGGGGSMTSNNSNTAYINPNNVGLGTVNNTTNNSTTTLTKYTFKTDLKLYKRHPDVIKLQQFLNNRGYIIAKKGAGSPGLESNYFGPATRSALIKFQIDNKIKPAQGYFGKITRTLVNSK